MPGRSAVWRRAGGGDAGSAAGRDRPLQFLEALLAQDPPRRHQLIAVSRARGVPERLIGVRVARRPGQGLGHAGLRRRSRGRRQDHHPGRRRRRRCWRTHGGGDRRRLRLAKRLAAGQRHGPRGDQQEILVPDVGSFAQVRQHGAVGAFHPGAGIDPLGLPFQQFAGPRRWSRRAGRTPQPLPDGRLPRRGSWPAQCASRPANAGPPRSTGRSAPHRPRAVPPSRWRPRPARRRGQTRSPSRSVPPPGSSAPVGILPACSAFWTIQRGPNFRVNGAAVAISRPFDGTLWLVSPL